MVIKVKHSGTVKLTARKNARRGDLFIAEALKNIPFRIRRVYFINNLNNLSVIRGEHAHKKLSQVIFCLNGSFTLSLDDGTRKQNIRLNDPGVGVILGPKLWHAMSKFSKHCIFMVLASDYHKESDYIRDYDAFLRLIKR